MIEQELVGILHSAGVSGIENKSAAAAIDEAADRGLISNDEMNVLHQIRKVRNPTVHFRLGVDDDALPRRAIEEEVERAYHDHVVNWWSTMLLNAVELDGHKVEVEWVDGDGPLGLHLYFRDKNLL